MNFLQSLRADLFSKRLLPLMILVCLGLAGAIAYVVNSSGSTPEPAASTAAPIRHTNGGTLSSVSEAPANPNEAASETTSGARYQNQGHAHDPFKALESKETSTTSTTSTSTTPATTPSASTGGSTPTQSSPSTGSEKTTSTPKKKPKPGPVYTVDVAFGSAPTTPGAPPEPKTYEDLKRLAPIPSAQQPLLIYTGVSSSGKGVILTLVHEAIIKGEAVCLPSASQCEMLDMAPGETEQLDYLQSNGETLVYELKVLSISKSTKDASTASRLNGQVSKAGLFLLDRFGPPALHMLRFSQGKDVLVYMRHH